MIRPQKGRLQRRSRGPEVGSTPRRYRAADAADVLGSLSTALAFLRPRFEGAGLAGPLERATNAVSAGASRHGHVPPQDVQGRVHQDAGRLRRRRGRRARAPPRACRTSPRPSTRNAWPGRPTTSSRGSASSAGPERKRRRGSGSRHTQVPLRRRRVAPAPLRARADGGDAGPAARRVGRGADFEVTKEGKRRNATG